jgi:PTS system nitrogen regulatory IIA component
MTDHKPLHQYLDARIISVHSKLSSPKKLLQEMARLLALPLQEQEAAKSENSECPENIEKAVYHALLEREKLGNTGIGNGVALPHSRFAHTDSAVIAIITLAEPIDYDSMDKTPVDVAFGLIVPQQATQEHLTLLAAIARMMSVEENRQQLLSSQTAEQILASITQWSN